MMMMVKEAGTLLEKPLEPTFVNKDSKFRKATQPSFHEDYDPTLPKRWVMQLEMVLTIMGYTNAQKMVFDTYILEGEVEH